MSRTSSRAVARCSRTVGRVSAAKRWSSAFCPGLISHSSSWTAFCGRRPGPACRRGRMWRLLAFQLAPHLGVLGVEGGGDGDASLPATPASCCSWRGVGDHSAGELLDRRCPPRAASSPRTTSARPPSAASCTNSYRRCSTGPGGERPEIRSGCRVHEGGVADLGAGSGRQGGQNEGSRPRREVLPCASERQHVGDERILSA